MPSAPQNGKSEPPHKRPGRQMALLLVTAGVSFALGMTVGRNTAPVDSSVKIKIPADRIQNRPKDELTFYKTLPAGTPPALGSGINRQPQAPPPPSSATPEKSNPVATVQTAPPPPSPPEIAAAERGSWQLQAASLPAENDARALCKRLRAKGYSVHYETATVKGKTWYRVYVGPYDSTAAAQAAASRLKSQEKLSALVRKR